MRSLDRPIFMDGRPHPPAYAPHTWTGFSTGEWVGNTLKVTTTHLKDGYLKRGGPQTSDMYTMTEFITRHGEILTIVTVVDDPIYMDEPYVESTTYTIDPTASVAIETCNSSSFAENGGTNRHWVPHFLPGQNTALTEWLKTSDWIPAEPTRGGVKTLYPEYRSTLNGSVNISALKVPSSRSANAVDKRIAEESPRDGEVHVLPVQGNVSWWRRRHIAVSLGAAPLVNTGRLGCPTRFSGQPTGQCCGSAPTTNSCFGRTVPVPGAGPARMGMAPQGPRSRCTSSAPGAPEHRRQRKSPPQGSFPRWSVQWGC
jgi:hypothetical protein